MPVRSSLPQNYQISEGTLIEDFETGFTAVGTNAVVSYNTDHVKTGSKSVHLEGPSGSKMVKTVNYDLSHMRNIGLWVYLDRTTISGGGGILYLSSTTTWSKYFYAPVGYLAPGWNYIKINKDNFTNSGNDSFSNPIVRMQILVDSSTPVYFDSLYLNPEHIPKCVISFDSALSEHYSVAFPLMQQYGLKGTVYVDTALVGQSGRATWEQLQEMYEAGWTIGNSTPNHTNMATLGSVDEIKAVLQQGIDDLTDNGMPKGAYHSMACNDGYNANVFQALEELGIKTFRSTDSDFQPTPATKHYLRAFPVSYSTTLAQIYALADKAMKTEGTSFILHHHITDTSGSGYGCLTSTFNSQIRYLVAKNIDCISTDEWDIGLINPRYRSI